MLKFKYTRVAGQRTLSLTPQKLPGMFRAMQKRATWDGVTVFPVAKLGRDGEGQFPVLSFGWYPGFGYETHFMELNGDSHFVATSTKHSAPQVYVELGGHGQELWPRELFVPYAIAEQAARREQYLKVVPFIDVAEAPAGYRPDFFPPHKRKHPMAGH